MYAYMATGQLLRGMIQKFKGGLAKIVDTIFNAQIFSKKEQIFNRSKVVHNKLWNVVGAERTSTTPNRLVI
jgi:hypothetical protein